ncbi:MAG TPA: methyltransferase domain-containing protein, partial [Polyangiaceae bacterium]|nr:methyltransferase domain-containing protein [Polyangiaceae bacterium]
MSGRSLLIAQLDAMHQSRGGDWYYRTFAPGRAMAALEGVYVVNVDQAHRRLPEIVEGADVLVINGVCDPDLLPLIAARKQARRPTVFEINDDVQEIQPSNPLAGFFGQPQNVRLFRRLAQGADAVQYSVPELERLYGSLNARGRVFVNQLVAPPPLRAPSASDRVSIGWGGSAGHLEDMMEIAPGLTEFVLGHPAVTLQLMCSDRIWKLFDALPSDRKRRTPIGSIDDYYAFVSQLDIGIAPNRDKGFNRARSDVKFLEYAGFGAVPVVQRLTPYLDSVEHGENGFFFDDPAELFALLSRLVADPVERQRVRRQAHDYVLRERIQATHAPDRLRFYRELSSEGAEAPTSEPERLFGELTRLDGAERSGHHVLLAHTRFEALLHDGLVAVQENIDRDRGAALLREAAKLEPTHSLPELVLGVQLQSEADLRAAVTKNPRSVQALLALGSHFLERGQFMPALERFLAAAEIAPGYEMPFALAARAVGQLGGVKEAAEFERIATSLARSVMPVERPAPLRKPDDRPAWQLLDDGVHLETLSPDYAPTGLLELIPRARRVLDLGCFCGGTGRFLKQRFPGCQVVGVEMLEKAATMAAEVYDQVHVGTLERLDFENAGLEPGSFDVIVAADVLEHLFNPWQALLRLRPLLSPDGALYVSLPNVRNLKLMSDLAKGRFDYEGAGILDVTHVRFFTRRTATLMFEQTGFKVDEVRINPDARLRTVFEGKDLKQITSV